MKCLIILIKLRTPRPFHLCLDFITFATHHPELCRENSPGQTCNAQAISTAGVLQSKIWSRRYFQAQAFAITDIYQQKTINTAQTTSDKPQQFFFLSYTKATLHLSFIRHTYKHSQQVESHFTKLFTTTNVIEHQQKMIFLPSLSLSQKSHQVL